MNQILFHHFSSHGLGWDKMLKTTCVKLDLVSDIDMLQFIEKGIRWVLYSTKM